MSKGDLGGENLCQNLPCKLLLFLLIVNLHDLVQLSAYAD